MPLIIYGSTTYRNKIKKLMTPDNLESIMFKINGKFFTVARIMALKDAHTLILGLSVYVISLAKEN